MRIWDTWRDCADATNKAARVWTVGRGMVKAEVVGVDAFVWRISIGDRPAIFGPIAYDDRDVAMVSAQEEILHLEFACARARGEDRSFGAWRVEVAP